MKEVPFSGEVTKKTPDDPSKKKGSDRVKHVRTYRDDVAELITKKKVTRTHVAIAEEERRRALGESSVWEAQKPTSMAPLFVAGIFLLVGVSILFYDIAGKSIPLFQGPKETQPFLVSGEKTHMIGLSTFTRDALAQEVRTVARGEKLEQGDHVRIGYRARTGTTSLALPLRTFFSALNATIPDVLQRSLSPAYEGGLMSAGETKGYLVFTSTYYENSAVGILSWEKRMVQDLYPIVDPLRAELIPSPSEGSWVAQTWSGYDLRVFTTTDGRVALVYGWLDRKTLIITGSIQTFSEITRLLQNKG